MRDLYLTNRKSNHILCVHDLCYFVIAKDLFFRPLSFVAIIWLEISLYELPMYNIITISIHPMRSQYYPIAHFAKRTKISP